MEGGVGGEGIRDHGEEGVEDPLFVAEAGGGGRERTRA